MHARIRPWFARQRISYPPPKLRLVVIKDQKRLKVYAPLEHAPESNWRMVAQYQVAKLSGGPGPKLRAGDKQVPEGIYSITHLNPVSKYWLSLGLNYPNHFDRSHARSDGRSKLGGDIMIHGWWFSTGCVAVGNTAAEDLFVLAHDVGRENIKVIISPTDFSSTSPASARLPHHPSWTRELYEDLAEEFKTLDDDSGSTDTRLIAYNDLQPPPAPKKSFFEEFLDALVEAAQTSATKAAEPQARAKQ